MDDNLSVTEKFVGQARQVLIGRHSEPAEAVKLAKQLIGVDAYYWARRLLEKILSRGGIAHVDRQKLAHQLALATYKDPSVLRDSAFDKALEVLGQEFDLATTEDQETLGQVGSIYKRRWRLDGRREWLERSLHFYRRGFECGVAGDGGYTAVNAAFLQDLLAFVEERSLEGAAAPTAQGGERRADARRIREAIVAELGAEIEAPDGTQEGRYWRIATLAEVQFGLGRLDAAGDLLARAAAVPGVADWMRKTTVEQLVHLTQLQLHTSDPKQVGESPQWKALTRLVGDERAPAVRTMFSGKVGLALSGGGFRASLYHLGVLAKLAELDMLRHVEVLSCVSGGSIIGAHYYLELRRLLQFERREGARRDDTRRGSRDDEISHQDYIDLVAKLIDDFLDGVQKNLRVRVLSNPVANLKMLFNPTYSRTERLGDLYEKHLYSRVDDGPVKGAAAPADDRRPKHCRTPYRWLNDLRVSPPDEQPAFSLDDVNWRRQNKIPQLVLNATTLNTGHVWQFTAAWMGESPNIIERAVDKNPRYRRFYYGEAPERYRCIRLGHAVAASSCVPGLFEPIELPSLYEDTNVRLVDGGVYDNLGVASLAEQGCSVMFVSDASGQLGDDDDPAGGILGPLMRSTSVMMGRIRGTSYEYLQARRRSGLLKGFAYVHLTQGLEAQDIDWKGSERPADAPSTDSGNLLTPYGIRCDVQRRLAAIRTDLDSFSDVEAFALMNSGYHAMGKAANEITGFPLKHGHAVRWSFLELDTPMQSANGAGPRINAKRLDKHLRAAPMKFFKVWRLSPWLLAAAALVASALVVGVVAWGIDAWKSDPEASLLATAPMQAVAGGIEGILKLENLFWTFVTLAGGYLALALLGKRRGKQLKQFFRVRSIAQRAAIGAGVGLFGWIVAAVHLVIFDRLFIHLGRLRGR